MKKNDKKELANYLNDEYLYDFYGVEEVEAEDLEETVSILWDHFPADEIEDICQECIEKFPAEKKYIEELFQL